MLGMEAMPGGSVRSRTHTVSAKCPYSPFGGTALMLPHLFSMSPRARAVTYSLSPITAIGEVEAGYRISSHRSRCKRGPPELLAL